LFETIVGILILLGVLIFIHEFGHFAVAKLVGVKVLKFSLGFPPAAISRTWGETEYVIGWLPIGGYVKLFGQDPESDEEILPEDEARTFTAQPLWARAAIVIAGPAANFLLAIFVISLGCFAGWSCVSTEINEVLENKPAQAAGIKTGDVVKSVDGVMMKHWEEMRSIISEKPGQEVTLVLDRGGREVTIQVTPEKSEKKDPFGNYVGLIGVTSTEKMVRLGLGTSMVEGWRLTIKKTGLILKSLSMVLQLKLKPKDFGGPILIAQISGKTLKKGWTYFIGWLTFISINLAIINLLPIPILDGGHLLFFFIEAVTRRPVTGRIREWATQAGLVFIVFIFVLVIYNDISRILTYGWGLNTQ
jgi:regulator of sigma E protease